MKFMIGEGGWSWLERAAYRGAIGLFYDTTMGGVLSYLIFGLVCLFAVIGFFATIKWLFTRKRKKKETAGERWLRTGKFD